jgi:hypothetical protein
MQGKAQVQRYFPQISQINADVERPKKLTTEVAANGKKIAPG